MRRLYSLQNCPKWQVRPAAGDVGPMMFLRPSFQAVALVRLGSKEAPRCLHSFKPVKINDGGASCEDRALSTHYPVDNVGLQVHHVGGQPPVDDSADVEPTRSNH